MTFSEQLNAYINQLDCTSKDLVIASGLTTSAISRYRSGERSPSIKSTQLNQLADGLYKLFDNKEINITREEIYTSLSNTLNDISINFEELSMNFNELVTTLNINMSELSRSSNYDSSYLSKIRNGSRNPSNPKDFVETVCNFIIKKYKSESDRKAISLLINSSNEELIDDSAYYNKLLEWFSTNSAPSHNYINDFLKSLDTFDLNEYIKAIHFNELKIPYIPFYKASSKKYYGLDEMKKGELDFFKATVLSKSTDPIFMCSDMPMEDMAQDIDFGKKWMFAIAMTLKKGFHLNIIHNLNRPFNEMMLGLESWIPIYMTGQVSPYYLKGVHNNVYCHLDYVSSIAALSGECINGHHDKGMYSLITNKSDLLYYKEKSKYLLNKATSLMDIYRAENKHSFNSFLTSSINIPGKRRRILSSLPIHTISNELLVQILKHNNISDADIKIIQTAIEEQQHLVENLVKNNILDDEISELSEEEFNKNSTTLFLADIFYEKEIHYTYNEYLKHLEITKNYERTHENYILSFNPHHTFRNIQVLILEKNLVMISKNKSPSIHFVIHHPKLCNAIENFIPPIIE